MNKSEAIKFLQQHQPLPSDEHLSTQTIQTYDKVREYFLNHPDSECIPLFLNSFGEGSGHGVYQLIEDVIRRYSKDEIIPHLTDALSSKYKSVYHWNAEIAALFPDTRLIEPLSNLLIEPDPDVRYATVTALEQINNSRVIEVLEKAIINERDEEITELIEDVLVNLQEE